LAATLSRRHRIYAMTGKPVAIPNAVEKWELETHTSNVVERNLVREGRFDNQRAFPTGVSGLL
jgi:hypothetical protein